MIPVILCGGSGTRLWPASRGAHPKQFLNLVGEDSLLQATIRRVNGPGFAAPLVVSNQDYRFLIAEQLQAIGVKPGRLVLEPAARNTAPAIAAAALLALQDDPDALLLVLASDHVILDQTAFLALLPAAEAAAQAGKLVTFGIVPDCPHTGYGYIKREAVAEGAVYPVAAFVEKPDQMTAQRFLDSGDYYWNSGMFMFRADTLLAELQQFQPDMLAAVKTAVNEATVDLDFTRLGVDAFNACTNDSIDYAVMEKTQRAAVIPADIGWSDIGTWSALRDVLPQDSAGNATRGDVLLHDTRNTLVQAGHRLVATLGVDNLVVVETADAVLIAHSDRAQDIKHIVEQLKRDGRGETTFHLRVYRPWGNYETIDLGGRYQVKRIVVKPGATLSLQMHYHRAEHWIVASGTAEVTCGERVFMLSENQSTYIPLGEKHRLRNPGKVPLEIIEVQSGAYLGEDDIVRFEDVYGRG